MRYRIMLLSAVVGPLLRLKVQPVCSQEGGPVHPERTIRAISAREEPPVLDGVLDDAIWRRAPIATDFIQNDPQVGEPATEKTTFQVAYDDEALYVGVQCFDREPWLIEPRLSRRDYWLPRDEVSVVIDPHHDHQTGYYFNVGPSGFRHDGVLYGDASADRNWDGVWELKTSLHDRGWSAEYRIPYHVLRFSPGESQTWGINVIRAINRRWESDHWILIPNDEENVVFVSRFGHLVGIEGVEPPAHLEVLPFAVTRSTLSPESTANPDGRDQLGTVGVDLRYGLTSNISLNATVNPDFGQVESDPAVLNLSVFETFFEERNPFFVEGNSIFDSPERGIDGIDFSTRLFHSRRIGRRPSHFSAPDGSTVIDQPDRTTILAALKLSGKTADNISFGLLNAVTDEEHAIIEETILDEGGVEQISRRRFRLTPYANYLVGRVQRDLWTNSALGATVTSVNGQDISSANVASADADLKWDQNRYQVYTRVSGSRTGPDGNRNTGYEGLAWASKNSGFYRSRLYGDIRSRGFEVNDLGFLSRNNRMQAGARGSIRADEPWRLARRTDVAANIWSQWNLDDVNLSRGVNLTTWSRLHNYWSVWGGIGRHFEATSDLETRGGPLMTRPASTSYWIGFATDGRKQFSVDISFEGDRGLSGRNDRKRVSFSPSIRPIPNLQMSIEPGYQKERRFAQWITNVDDDSDGTADHFVFGELKNDLFDVRVRTTVAFHPDLTLQLFMQPFVTVGDYGDIKELARPESYEFTPYDNLDSNPDFSLRSLRSNLVLRWEYRLGSTLFFVWSQSRAASREILDPDFEPLSGLGKSFADDGDNISSSK